MISYVTALCAQVLYGFSLGSLHPGNMRRLIGDSKLALGMSDGENDNLPWVHFCSSPGQDQHPTPSILSLSIVLNPFVCVFIILKWLLQNERNNFYLKSHESVCPPKRQKANHNILPFWHMLL